MSSSKDNFEEIHFRSKLFGTSKHSTYQPSKKERKVAESALSQHYELLHQNPDNPLVASELITLLEEKIGNLDAELSKKENILGNMISLFDEHAAEDQYNEDEN